MSIEFSIILTQQNDFLFQANDQAAVAQPTMSRLLLQLIQDGHPAPGFCDEDILLESPEDTGLDVIASAEAIRRLAQTPQDQAVMNSEEQVFRTRFLVTLMRHLFTLYNVYIYCFIGINNIKFLRFFIVLKRKLKYKYILLLLLFPL